MIKTIGKNTYFIFILLALLGTPSLAQTDTNETQKPLEITAEKSLEWFRTEQKVIARGNAKASQEKSSITAETLSANYREGKQGRFEISKLFADENVVIETNSANAFGDKAVYNLDQSIATLTGENLRMISPDQTVTAKDRFEYHVNKGQLLAIGDAIAIRPNINGGQDRLNANTISATFKNNANGERVLETLEAKGNVIITTPTEKVTGAYGIYRANTNKAEITGNVVITRGPNTLEGERAEVDLNTNKSRIFGGGNTNNGRVKAVFFPGSNEE
ncbi:MAG: LptA/OstA family protein [Bdellovibrionales bacterium]